MISFGERAAETASRLIKKYGSDYVVNGKTLKGIQKKDTKEFLDRGLIQTDERVYVFSSVVNIGDLVTINNQQWYTTFSETKSLSNVDIVSIAVVKK